MNTNNQTSLTPIEVCTLIAHEAVSMLDTVQTEMPDCMKGFRTALEALHTVHVWAMTVKPCWPGWTWRSPAPKSLWRTARTCPT